MIYLPSLLFVCPTRVRTLLENWKEKLQVIFEIATFFANLTTFEIDTWITFYANFWKGWGVTKGGGYFTSDNLKEVQVSLFLEYYYKFMESSCVKNSLRERE